eukprot:gene4141-biopygen1970
MYVETIVPIQPHDELLVPYGDEYWLNNEFDKDIVGKAYEEYKKESTMERWENKLASAVAARTRTEDDGTLATAHNLEAGTAPDTSSALRAGLQPILTWSQITVTTYDAGRRRSVSQ